MDKKYTSTVTNEDRFKASIRNLFRNGTNPSHLIVCKPAFLLCPFKVIQPCGLCTPNAERDVFIRQSK